MKIPVDLTPSECHLIIVALNSLRRTAMSADSSTFADRLDNLLVRFIGTCKDSNSLGEISNL